MEGGVRRTLVSYGDATEGGMGSNGKIWFIFVSIGTIVIKIICY